MLTPQHSAAYRLLPLYPPRSTLRVLRQAPQLTALVVVSAGSSPARQQQRGCFFGHRVWSSYLDPDFQRRLERRRKALKHRYVEALLRKRLWDRGPNRPSWTWKLSSSLGVPSREDCQAEFRPGGRWVSSDKGPSQSGKGDAGGRRDKETRHERMERRMEEIRRMLDEDPFRALFGYRMRNLGRFPSSIASGDLASLLNWGRTSCADIMSRLTIHSQGGRGGMEEQARTSWKIVNTEEKAQTKTSSGDPVQSTATDEFEFDPITMRRVPKKPKVDSDPVDSALKSSEQSVDNSEKHFDGHQTNPPTPLNASTQGGPVEAEPLKYTPSYSGSEYGSGFAMSAEQPQNPANADLKKYKAKYSWLEREGFADVNKNLKDQPGPSEPVNARVSSLAPAEIPRVRDFEIPSEPPFEVSRAATGSSRLHYDTSEPKVEDLDLLCPSDVRASAGILKSRRAETEAERQRGRERLENEFREATESEALRAEEGEAIKFLRKNSGVKGRQEAMPKGDGGAKAAVTDRKGDLYNQAPQDLETCYDQEVKVQRAIIREAEAEAEAGGYDMTPQGLETLHTRDMETQEQPERKTAAHGKAPQVLQTSLDRQIETHQTPAPGTDVHGYEIKPMGLETSYTREIESQGEQAETPKRPESWDELSEEDRQHVLSSELEKLPTYQSDGSELPITKLNPGTQEPELSRKENDQFVPRTANDLVQTMSAESIPQFELLIRGNRNPKLAANKRRRQRDRELIREIRGIYEDKYGPINIEHRMNPSLIKGPQDGSPDLQVNNALTEHDRNLGPNAYRHAGDDGLEAEILAKPHPQSSHKTKTPEHLSPEELAMRWEEKEQILQEEVKEVNDLLHEVQSEFDAVKAKSSARVESSHTIVYKILAYDSSTNELTSGTTTSSTNSEILPPSEVIPRLTHPAKFLPALTALKKDGYEIVSGGSNVLVLKRVHEGPFIEEEDPIEDEYHHLPSSSLYPYVNPIDGTTTGNFASPTGFVNHDAIFSSPFSDTDAQPLREPPPTPSPTATRPPSSSPTDKIKREETVFSGQSKWKDITSSTQEGARPRKGRVKKAAKRVFWVGLWVAGCSYAVGVMGEFFRTGGADGGGPQWFSGFH
ncbi:MAG: hypothetical protein M1839_000346 [Geoglossum umbratile]|nr:MAG: hypothetical protein M1839_000346 [Geoglossum umbratile]